MKQKTLLQAGLLALVAVFGVSCSHERYDSVSLKKQEVELSVNLSMNQTRTVNQGNQTVWAESDSISLLMLPVGGTGYTPFAFEYYTGSTGSTFRGRITGQGEVNSWYAIYPYSKSVLTPKDLHITVDKNPVQNGNSSTSHLAGKNFPLYGKSTKLKWGNQINISMENILSVAKFNVTNTTSTPITVKSIEFTSSKNITGPFSADITQDDFEWESEKGTSTKVTLTVNDGEEIAAGADAQFYAGIISNICPAGSKMKVKVTASSNSKDVVFYRLIERTKSTAFYSGSMTTITCDFDAEHTSDPWPDSSEEEEEETDNYYYKVKTAPSNWEGTYLIVDESQSLAFAVNKESYGYAANIQISDSKILKTPAHAELEVTVTTSEKGAGKYDIKPVTKQYLYGFGSSILFSSNVSNSNTYYNTFSIADGKVTIASSFGEGRKKLAYKDGEFCYLNDEQAGYSTASVALYRLGQVQGDEPGDEPGDDPEKQTQTISFSNSEENWTLGDTYAIGSSYSIPSVSGAQTTLTYESSNPNVATIESGKIVIKAAGTTVIKATAAASDTYNQATASFTLNIKSSGEQPTTSAYVKVTSEPSSWDGTYLVVDESAGKAFAPFEDNASSYAVSVTISSGKIASDSSIDKYAITVSDGGKNHENDNVSGLRAYNVKNSNGKYIRWSSSYGEGTNGGTLMEMDSNTSSHSSTNYEYYHTFKYSSGVQMASAINTSSGNAYFIGYSSSKFAYSTDNSSSRVQLYKLTGGQSGKQDQSISFSKSAVTWTIGNGCEVGGTYSIQSLSGTYYTSVSYTSSNPSVATIDGSNVTVAGTGSTTITATAASSNDYNSATATYTLTINPAGSSTTSGYELLTSAPSDWSGTYLLVNADKTYLFNGEKSSNKVSLSSSDFKNNVITNTSYSQYAITISKSGDNYYFKKGNNYYSVSYSSSSSTGITTTTSQSDAAWTYDGMKNGAFLFYKYDSGQEKDMYIYYKTSDNTFKFGNSGKDVGILLYKYTGGSSTDPDTPDTPDEPQTGDYFVKVTSAPSSWTGTYLVVDESANKAFVYNSSSSYATSVTISNSKIAWNSDLDAIALRVSDAGLNHPNTMMASDISYSGTLRAYNVKTKDGDYIYASQSNVKTASSNTGSNGNYYHAFAYVSGGVYMFSSCDYEDGNSSQQYYYTLAYSSSKFAYGQGESKLAKCQLYKLNGESGGSTEPEEDEPETPSGTSFNLENDYLKQYLDAAATSYTNSTTNSVVTTYSGSSATRDLPKPVSLSWSGNATSISIYEGTTVSGTAVKTMEFSSSTSVDVYNLIPGKNYTYQTSNGKTGTFNTTGRRRMIKVSSTESQNNARNCRDLGGVQTRKGETLKFGLMYRGTNMDSVTDAEKKILLNELGIKLDQDLRGASSSPIGVTVSGKTYTAENIYSTSKDNDMKTTVSDVMNSVINGNPVYIHCQIGSDRTGHMCMLYLALLGCELKECDIDYEITSFASKMTYGTRTRGSNNEKSFRNRFVTSTYDADHTPEAIQDYVVNTLEIPLDTVKKFRKAMGVSETL